MKHSKVKGQTIPMIKRIIVTEKTIAKGIERLSAHFQHCYTCFPKNEFKIEGDFLVCDSLILATMTPEDLSHLGTVVSQEHNEKINRYVTTLTNFRIDMVEHLPKEGAIFNERVLVTFRAGGDYVVEFEGKKSYGSKLKASDFNEKGFEVLDFSGNTMEYVEA